MIIAVVGWKEDITEEKARELAVAAGVLCLATGVVNMPVNVEISNDEQHGGALLFRDPAVAAAAVNASPPISGEVK